MSKSLKWYLRRHSLLYKIRFRLISKYSTAERIEGFNYNSDNPKYDIPDIYFQLNCFIFPQGNEDLSDLKKAIKIAKWLRNKTKGGPGLGESSDCAVRKMLKGEGGVCSDFAQVYNNFCIINDLKVKEWGLKVLNNNPNTLGGHSFNEIYSKEIRKWIIIDVAKCIYFYHSDSRLPLSVFDLIALKNEHKEVKYFPFNKKIPADSKRIYELYLVANSFPFVITNYCNKTCDYFLKKLDFLPVSLIHGILFLTRNSYSFEFPMETTYSLKQRPVIAFEPTQRKRVLVMEEIAK